MRDTAMLKILGERVTPSAISNNAGQIVSEDRSISKPWIIQPFNVVINAHVVPDPSDASAPHRGCFQPAHSQPKARFSSHKAQTSSSALFRDAVYAAGMRPSLAPDLSCKSQNASEPSLAYARTVFADAPHQELCQKFYVPKATSFRGNAKKVVVARTMH
jgi:hypothetical protein